MPLLIAEVIAMPQRSKIIYQQNISLLKVISNYTPSVALILIIFLMSFQFFFESFYQSDFVFEISLLYAGLLILEIVLVYVEYRGSVFFIDTEKIFFRRFSQKKGIDQVLITDIKEYYVNSLNFIIEDKANNRLVLDYMARPEILKVILKEITEKKII
jgi:hypothetical protein